MKTQNEIVEYLKTLDRDYRASFSEDNSEFNLFYHKTLIGTIRTSMPDIQFNPNVRFDYYNMYDFNKLLKFLTP